MGKYQRRAKAFQELLAPYATPILGQLGKQHPEEQDTHRFPFQRDRDRIVHCQAFRRLKGKTQVFVSGIGDHYRTRLTHTMEVSQISRDIARSLGLNEDLTECIALAHDLGHPPFGHAGEEAMNDWMQQYDSAFEHNQQSLRIVTILEYHSALHTGLNLNKEVLEGLQKHPTSPSSGGLRGASPYFRLRGLSLEAQVVNLADEIAYLSHDTDDGIVAGLLDEDALQSVPIIAESKEHYSKRFTSLRGALITILINDLYTEAEKRIAACDIASIEDVYNCQETVIALSDDMRAALDVLRAYLWEHLYGHGTVAAKAEEGKKIVTNLCESFMQSPPEKVGELQNKFDCSLEVAVKDYVAGMTDGYATNMCFSHE